MPDAEIEVIRKSLEANPRPAGINERRRRLDALGRQYPVPADVRIEAADANRVAAEWTVTPEADSAKVVLYLHGGGYTAGSLASHRHMVVQAGLPSPGTALAAVSPLRCWCHCVTPVCRCPPAPGAVRHGSTSREPAAA